METTSFDLIEEFHSEDIMSVNHAKLIHRLSVTLDRYTEQYDVLPKLELKLNGKPVKPDVSIYPRLPEDWDNDIIFYTQPPIIAIEIQSPKQATTEITTKMNDIYFPAGVQSVWIIIPPLRLVFIQTPDGQKTPYTQGIIQDPVTNIAISFDSIFR
jgi:Uma2 family endonuclease